MKAYKLTPGVENDTEGRDKERERERERNG